MPCFPDDAPEDYKKEEVAMTNFVIHYNTCLCMSTFFRDKSGENDG